MNCSKIVFFDLEMCCWDDGRDPRTGEIIEIGLCEADLTKSEITKRAQYYVKPEKDEISEFCTSLTGITPRTIRKQGRPLEDVVNTMIKNFGGSNKVYAAWGRDDVVLFKECDIKGVARPFREYLNVSVLYRIHTRTGNKRFGMRKALHKEGLEFEGTQHSGYDDALNLARLGLKFM